MRPLRSIQVAEMPLSSSSPTSLYGGFCALSLDRLDDQKIKTYGLGNLIAVILKARLLLLVEQERSQEYRALADEFKA